MSGKHPTPAQQAARDAETKKTLIEAAKSGNVKAKSLLTVKGGKKK